MKKYFITVWLVFIIFLDSYGQDVRKSLDLIIVIDDNIAVGSIASLQIERVSASSTELMTATYYPGSLSVAEADYRKLMCDSTRAINLKFINYQYKGQAQIAYRYDIELKREWLGDYFNILRIYNLDKRKYKGKYRPSGSDKNYAYEIESPSHSYRLIERGN
jgi:hypothetical protein